MMDKESQIPNPTPGVQDLEEELIGTRLVAKLLGVGPTSVRRYERNGSLPAVQETPGGHRKWRKSDVIALLARLRR